MKNKLKYFFVGFIIILSVMIVNAQQFPSPNEPRDCYKWGVTEGLYMCFVPLTGEYATWFYSYIEMHEYYTPQLKEINVTAGETQTLTTSPKKASLEYDTLMVTGSPSYIYAKHI